MSTPTFILRHVDNVVRIFGKSDKHIDELADEFEKTTDTGTFLLQHFS